MIQEISQTRLLQHAERLARGPGGAGRPRNADLRRAVSAAYYALFHAITLTAVETQAPRVGREAQLRLVRAFKHSDVSTVCRWVQNHNKPLPALRPVVDELRHDNDIANLCSTFIDLQQRRHEADYDHLADFTRAGTLLDVQRAERAVLSAEGLPSGQIGETFLFLVTMKANAS